jgi:hypothetical protein
MILKITLQRYRNSLVKHIAGFWQSRAVFLLQITKQILPLLEISNLEDIDGEGIIIGHNVNPSIVEIKVTAS